MPRKVPPEIRYSVVIVGLPPRPTFKTTFCAVNNVKVPASRSQRRPVRALGDA